VTAALKEEGFGMLAGLIGAWVAVTVSRMW